MLPTLFLALAAPVAEASPPPRLVGEWVQVETATGILYGTIDLPSTPGPWPVVILHAGSGPTDRDGNGPLIATNCLKLTGRGLAAEGIAVLRIDKRGVGASAKALPKEEEIRIEVYAADVIAWTELLRKDRRFTKLGYMGHSEGVLIGLIAAKQVPFDAFISLCGPGRPLQDVLGEQLKKNLPDKLFQKSKEIITELEAGRTVKDIPKELAALFRPSVQPFLISTFRNDPGKLIAGVPCPVLIVSGTTDIQVGAADAARLHESNAKSKLVTIVDMNHVLKMVKTTDPTAQLSTYADAFVPLHPELLPALVRFLKPALNGK